MPSHARPPVPVVRALGPRLGGLAVRSARRGAAGGRAERPGDASYFVPISLPIAARAALWAGELAAARDIVDRLEASPFRGQAIGLDLVTLRAGLAALEGRRADAIAGYREALRGWRGARLCVRRGDGRARPGDPPRPDRARDGRGARPRSRLARETLTRLGATPLLARLDEATAPKAAAAGIASGGRSITAPAVPAGSSAEAAVDR